VTSSNKTLVTIYNRGERPVMVGARYALSQGAAKPQSAADIRLAPEQADSFFLGPEQDLLISEIQPT
jgi:hypothetical protein